MPTLLQRTTRRSATRQASRAAVTHVRASPVGGRLSGVQQVQRVAGNAAAFRLLRSRTSPPRSPQSSSDAGLEFYVNAARGSGRPLSAVERAHFEPRFGVDFGR